MNLTQRLIRKIGLIPKPKIRRIENKDSGQPLTFSAKYEDCSLDDAVNLANSAVWTTPTDYMFNDAENGCIRGGEGHTTYSLRRGIIDDIFCFPPEKARHEIKIHQKSHLNTID